MMATSTRRDGFSSTRSHFRFLQEAQQPALKLPRSFSDLGRAVQPVVFGALRRKMTPCGSFDWLCDRTYTFVVMALLMVAVSLVGDQPDVDGHLP